MRGFGDVLRGLGSVLNPQVAQELAAEDRQQGQVANQIGLMGLQQRMQQQSPEYQARLESLKNEKMFREEIAGANGDLTKIAGAAVKYGKPELAVNLYNQQEQRAARLQQSAEAIELRKVQMQQAHEMALQRIQDGQQRQEEVKRHNLAMESLNAQNAALNAEIKRQGLMLQGLGVQLQRESLDLKKAQEGAGGLTPENAGKVAMSQQAVEGITKAKGMLFDKDGNFNSKLAAMISTPGFAGLPFSSDARVARTALRNAVEAKLRIETGAAATESEVNRTLARFMPSPMDTKESAAYKLDELQKFFESSLAQTKGVKQTPPKAPEGKVVDFGSLK
jgi:hypothetical protein